jgi:uncharacterized membrane protein
MKNFWQGLSDLLKGRNPGMVGAVSGLILALSIVIFGLGKTLFILALTSLGYYIGARYFSSKEDFRNLLDKILPPGMFR